MPSANSLDRINDRVFNAIYSRSLVYNTCWEDPAVDRIALELGPDDDVMVIASAGCNALDYALEAPRSIAAVDMNPRQIALLELKLAGIRALEFDDYFELFGNGTHTRFDELYGDALRAGLSPFAREYWDRNGRVFQPGRARRGLYFHGLSGKVARAFHFYLGFNRGLRDGVEAILNAQDVEAQRQIYDSMCRPYFWTPRVNWLLSTQFTMNMLGVPHPQRKEVERQHDGGVAAFIKDAIEYVFRYLPLSLNYFWRVYLTGRYSRECCPEYLKKENFLKLKDGLVDRIHPYTGPVTQFLKESDGGISRFVMLDHMDWMSSWHPAALQEEWDAVFAAARKGARAIFRSAHAWPGYLESVNVSVDEAPREPLMNRLRFHPELATELTRSDRVHTYAGFHIADLATA